jgi:hypothetical protein
MAGWLKRKCIERVVSRTARRPNLDCRLVVMEISGMDGNERTREG